MSFNHILVSDLPQPAETDLHNQSQSADFPWKLDGIPVRREVYDLGTELRRSFKGYRFHAAKRMNNRIVRPYKDGGEKMCYADVQVYIEGSDYVVGRIGYGDSYGISTADKSTYMIHSRKIGNEKFAAHRDQYYMSFVGDIKRAVKVGLTKLTPYSPKEMAGLTYYDFKYNIEEVRSNIRGSLNGVLSPLQSANVLLPELKGLIAQGVQFSTPEFQAAAEKVLAADREWEAIRTKPMHGYYVYVRMVGDHQWVDVIDALDMQARNYVDDYSHTSFPVEDLPEDIQGKVSVLSMATIGQYMQGVGRRVSEKAFWIERG